MRKAFLLCFLTAFLLADGFFLGKGAILTDVVFQRAIVGYERGREILIISPTYQGKNTDFLWVIPTPSKPQVSKAPADIFDKIRLLVNSPYGKSYITNLYRPPSPTFEPFEGQGLPASIQSRTQKLPDIDFQLLQILPPTSGEAFYNWCLREGYTFPSSAWKLVKGYLDKGWYLVVLKIGNKKEKGTLVKGNIVPVKLEFKTDEIIYPLRPSLLNRYAVNPVFEGYDKVFGMNKSDITEIMPKVIETTKKDIKEKKPFEKSLLGRLGYDCWREDYERTIRGELKLGEFIEEVSVGVSSDLVFLDNLGKMQVWLITFSPYPLTFAMKPNKGGSAGFLPLSPLEQFDWFGVDREVINFVLTDQNGKPFFPAGKGKLYVGAFNISVSEPSALEDIVFHRASEGQTTPRFFYLNAPALPPVPEREKAETFKDLFSIARGIPIYLILSFLASPFGLIFILVSILYKKYPTRRYKILSVVFQLLTILWFFVVGMIFIIPTTNSALEAYMSEIDPLSDLFNLHHEPALYLAGATQLFFSAIALYVFLRQHRRRMPKEGEV